MILSQIQPNSKSSYSKKTPASPSAIEVLSIERGQSPGVLAVVAVRVGGILIRGVRVTNRGRGTFINYPSRKIADQWVDLVEIISPALHRAVVEAILAAVRMMGGGR